MIDPHISSFEEEKKIRIRNQSEDDDFAYLSHKFFVKSHQLKYSYNFQWLGRPIIQYPQDILAAQEIIFSVKPDIVIETGIAHGGSLCFYASLLCMLDTLEGKDPRQSDRRVIGVDIDIRPHNKKALDEHPLRFKIDLLQGSSIDNNIIREVHQRVSGFKKILLSLDSNHTHEHVLAELNAYARLVNKGSYCIVYDTCIQKLPPICSSDRSWDIGNNPLTAVEEWLSNNSDFVIDTLIDEKLMISASPKGYLKRI